MSMEIEVTIAPDGTTTVDVLGGDGTSCSLVTDAVAKAMGGAVLSDMKKPEFYQTTKASGKENVGGKEVW